MRSGTVLVILSLGGVLLVSGIAAFLMTSSRLSEVNGEIAKILPNDYNKLDTLNTLMMERDILASRIPWAIGAAFVGGICLAFGAYLKVRDRRKDDNAPAR